MRLIVGLGNPGPRYSQNRHNIGFMAVDELVRRHSFEPWRKRFQAECSEGRIGSHRLLVLKPQTYMNESGRAVGEALRYYKLEPADAIVIYDEIDLRLGKVRVKLNGGAGGHNGIRSIESHIGKDFWRIRLGVGHPGHKERVHGHVLSDFAKTETRDVEEMLDAVAAEWPLLLDGDDGAFMSRVAFLLNPPPPKPQPKPSPTADSDEKADRNSEGEP